MSGCVAGGGGGVGAAGGGAPDQDAGLGLLQPPALGLFTSMVVTAQRRQIAFAGPAALVMRLGVVEVAGGGAAPAARRGARGVARLDPVREFPAGPVAVLGLGMLAGAADDRCKSSDFQEVLQSADRRGSGRPWPGSPRAGAGGAVVGGGGAVGVQGGQAPPGGRVRRG